MDHIEQILHRSVPNTVQKEIPQVSLNLLGYLLYTVYNEGKTILI